MYTAQVESFTHGKTYDIMVSKEFLNREDKVLLIDDFLANGAALMGLISLVREAGASWREQGFVLKRRFSRAGRGYVKWA